MNLCLYPLYLLIIGCLLTKTSSAFTIKRSLFDKTITTYATKRTCWWNEACKKEFQANFECKCPKWSYCRGPGKYYNAFCSMTATGYVWYQRNNHEIIQ